MSKHQYLPHAHEEPDPWHRHAPSEGQPQEEHGARANPIVLSVALVASVLFLVLVMAVIYVYFSSFTTRLRREQIETVVLSQPYREYRLRAAEALADYNVLDPAVAPRGVITIPVEQARQRVLQRYGNSR